MILKDLKFGKKYLAITITVILLIIPIFFGIYIDFLVASEITLEVMLFLLIGFAILLGLGKLMEFLMYGETSKELMKQHDVVNALLNRTGINGLLVFFPLTMIMEELIFRYYLMGLLLNQFMIGSILAITI
ncbi:unnamed protein product, partial [marine sediment metagenome]